MTTFAVKFYRFLKLVFCWHDWEFSEQLAMGISRYRCTKCGSLAHSYRNIVKKSPPRGEAYDRK